MQVRKIRAVLVMFMTMAAALPAAPAAAATSSATVVYGLPSEITVGQTATLYGMVVDNTGVPVQGATVTLTAGSGTLDGQPTDTVTTDQSGDFLVTYTAPTTTGTDTITATADGDTGTVQVTVVPQGSLSGQPSPASDVAITVKTGSSSLEAGQTVLTTATVTQGGFPVAGVPVSVWEGPEQGTGVAVEDDNLSSYSSSTGEVEQGFTPLAGGPWIVGAQIMDGGGNIIAVASQTATVTVTGSATEQISLAASPSSVPAGQQLTLQGVAQAVYSDGTAYPLPLASLSISAPPGLTLSNPWVTADASGAFSLTATAVTAGTYTVTATEPQAGGTASTTVTVTPFVSVPAPPTHPDPPPPCVNPTGVPTDFGAVSCVVSLPGAGGTSTISFGGPQAAQASGETPGTLIVYQLSTSGLAHYVPTTISTAGAVITNVPIGNYAILLSQRTYSDVTGSTPTADRQAIDLITAAGAAVGFNNGAFRPGAPATQGQVAQMMSVVLGLTGPATDPSTPSAGWAEPYLAALNNALGDTPFMVLSPTSSGDGLTQGQFAALLAQALHLVTGSVTEQAGLTAVQQAGIMTVPSPNAPITRAQVAEALAAWIASQEPSQ